VCLFFVFLRLNSTDGSSQQEEILKETCVREREMRKAAERDKSFALSAKNDVETILMNREAEVSVLRKFFCWCQIFVLICFVL
jgi:hypothetical protein